MLALIIPYDLCIACSFLSIYLDYTTVVYRYLMARLLRPIAPPIPPLIARLGDRARCRTAIAFPVVLPKEPICLVPIHCPVRARE